MSDIVLRTSPWAIAGVVTDSRENRVAGAVVTIRPGDAFNTTFGVTTTDADGRYRLASASPHFDRVLLSAVKEGFEPQNMQPVDCCDSAADTAYNVRLVRVLSVQMTGPSTLRVGETVELPQAQIVLDTGVERLVYLLPSSSSPSEVAVGRGQRGYVIQGIRPGRAVITCDWQGVRGTLQVQVVAQ